MSPSAAAPRSVEVCCNPEPPLRGVPELEAWRQCRNAKKAPPTKGVTTITTSGASERINSKRAKSLPTTQVTGTNQFAQSRSPCTTSTLALKLHACINFATSHGSEPLLNHKESERSRPLQPGVGEACQNVDQHR